MYHKMDVYRAIQHPFTMAWIEFERERGAKLGMPAEAYFRMHMEEIADEVCRHAHVPSYGSARAVRDMVRRPWQVPHYTRDDGVESMPPGQIKNICLDWLAKNYR